MALFGKVAEALTGKPPPSYAVARRKRRDETQGAFRLVRELTKKITRSILDFLYLPSPYDPEQERNEAERFLRLQIDEWTQADEQEQHGSFHYGHAADFDPHR